MLELCEGTELFQEIQTHIAVKKNYAGKGQVVQGAMEEDIAARYFMQIALGVKYMQDRKILHRDLKLSNIMITQD